MAKNKISYFRQMLRFLRHAKFVGVFWSFMTLFMLNICIDPEDSYPRMLIENLSYNQQESIVELVVEKALGFEDAIDEYADTEAEQNTTTIKKHFSVEYIFQSSSFCLKKILYEIERKLIGGSVSTILSEFLEILSPPPKA